MDKLLFSYYYIARKLKFFSIVNLDITGISNHVPFASDPDTVDHSRPMGSEMSRNQFS